MFEASFLNGIQMRCSQHPRSIITHICTDYKCNDNPYLCPECKAQQKHYGHDLKIKQFIEAVTELSSSLTSSKKPIQLMYSKICSENQNDTLMKYQQQREQHCQSIRKHIQSIKFQIDQQINSIVKVFQKEIEKQRQTMFNDLERYYENYRQKFDYLSRKIGPIASVNNNFKYFASKSNILLKMLTDSEANSSVKWFNDLKKAAKAAEAMITDPHSQVQKIKNLSNTINQLMDKLPRVRSAEYQTQLPRILNSSSRQALRQFVKFGQIKAAQSSASSFSNISRSYSVQGETAQRSVQELQTK